MSEIVIDNFTIVSGIVLLAIGFLSSLFSPFFRLGKSKPDDGLIAQQPPLSVILTPHDEADKLERNLPYILQQEYPAGFQVIVVIDEGDHETEDIVKRFQAEFGKSLYMTYIPASSRYMSRKKLAMTLGVKAAKTEWLVFTEAYSRPASAQWLATMAQHCSDDTNLVIGYGCYEDGVSLAKHFERFHASSYLMREDSRGIAYRTLSHNIMLRKSDFMHQEGFRGNLELIRGEYDFLVNKYATDGGTALETRHDAWMVDDAPTPKSWLNKHLFYSETRKLLQRSVRHRAWFNADQTVMHASFWAVVAFIVFGALASNIIVMAAAVAALFIMLTLRTVFGYKALRAFDVRVPALLVFPLEMSVVWRNLTYIIRHRFTDKLDFTTHKQ